MLKRNYESNLPGRPSRHSRNLALLLIINAAVVMGGARFASAQSFSSGSNGSDGALNLTTPGTIIFDPKSFNPPLDPDGDGVFHFTTINIAAGVTVKLSGRIFPRPVFWLATGAVTINGIIDLNGEEGHSRSINSSVRTPSAPGAGGYSGGVGGNAAHPARPGNGPGGGAVQAGDTAGTGGTFTGNTFLVPLVGGSGGGGEQFGSSTFGAGGSSGGGAVLIASSVSITVNGGIAAEGGFSGSQGTAGAGSGGAIHLMAPTISGNGVLSTRGGSGPLAASGSIGRIRIEAFIHQWNFRDDFSNIPPASTTTGSPFNVFVPTLTSVRLVSVAGVPVNPNPTGSFEMPDVSINSGAAVTVVIEARNIPLGTVVKLHLFSESGPDQFVDSTPLAGTTQTSTATASVVLPSGFSRGFVRATWTQ